VAYAHRNLVVHRDLKPANVLVTQAGEVKLLDFGVAKLLGAHREEQTQNAPLTPAYAAPEQLTRGAITTATDVYALGMLLFELLSGSRPWRLTELPLLAGLEKVLREAPPAVSAVAEQQADAPVAPTLLRGDLDAIVAKALRKEPELRYETVSAFQTDIARRLNHEPVAARAGARLYVIGRFVRRHRLLIAGSGLLVLAVAAGVIGVAWQAARAEREAVRAEREAARARVVKDFLVSIFRASDPRVASNQPRGRITAKELLDDSTGRIDQEFSKDPDLEIELLGAVESIYALLNDEDHADALHRRRVALARATYGDHNPIVIDSMEDEVATALRHVDLADARRRLDRLDGLIRDAGLDHSAIRARWWLQQGQVLWSSEAAPRARSGALTNAVNLYAAADPTNEDYPVALNELGQSRMLEGDFAGAIACFERGIAVAQREPVPDDSVQVTLDKNLAQALRHENQRTRAEQLLASATGLAARTYGMDDRHYWEVVAAAAQMIHEDGNRGRAMDMFGDLMRRVPGEDGPFNSESDSSVAARVREIYGSALTVEGRPQLGIGLLESAERVYTKIPRHGRDLPRLRMSLGDAYDRVGRDEDARRELESALDGQLGQASPSGEDVLAARERWGRFLLAHGELAGAEVQLRETLGQARGRSLVQIALAQGDIARLDIARHDASAAARDAQLAVDQFELVQGFWAVPVAHLRPSAAAGRRPGERAALGEKGTRC
jgi:serine/threonine-protein kinase